mmetsp:Transcript_35884/g.58051  ORF Transcript_35884/g.58051 Transcript_35884/m.58051 type:complete len:287 (-) Transcript_35884:1825-2685(-)
MILFRCVTSTTSSHGSICLSSKACISSILLFFAAISRSWLALSSDSFSRSRSASCSNRDCSSEIFVNCCCCVSACCSSRDCNSEISCIFPANLRPCSSSISESFCCCCVRPSCWLLTRDFSSSIFAIFSKVFCWYCSLSVDSSFKASVFISFKPSICDKKSCWRLSKVCCDACISAFSNWFESRSAMRANLPSARTELIWASFSSASFSISRFFSERSLFISASFSARNLSIASSASDCDFSSSLCRDAHCSWKRDFSTCACCNLISNSSISVFHFSIASWPSAAA